MLNYIIWGNKKVFIAIRHWGKKQVQLMHQGFKSYLISLIFTVDDLQLLYPVAGTFLIRSSERNF